jgi:hypothetical protein
MDINGYNWTFRAILVRSSIESAHIVVAVDVRAAVGPLFSVRLPDIFSLTEKFRYDKVFWVALNMRTDI